MVKRALSTWNVKEYDFTTPIWSFISNDMLPTLIFRVTKQVPVNLFTHYYTKTCKP